MRTPIRDVDINIATFACMKLRRPPTDPYSRRSLASAPSWRVTVNVWPNDQSSAMIPGWLRCEGWDVRCAGQGSSMSTASARSVAAIRAVRPPQLRDLIGRATPSLSRHRAAMIKGCLSVSASCCRSWSLSSCSEHASGCRCGYVELGQPPRVVKSARIRVTTHGTGVPPLSRTTEM